MSSLKFQIKYFVSLVFFIGFSCSTNQPDSPTVPIQAGISTGTGGSSKTGWDICKEVQIPTCALTSEYQSPTRQPNATLGWEDGVYISRDGLTLYAQYSQMDLFKATIEDGKANPNLYPYKRGPSLGQDLSAPAGLTVEWMHSDLVYSTRASVNNSFPAWTLSAVRKSYFNDAAPQGILNASDPSKYDIFLYTDDDTNPAYFAPKIRIIRNTSRHPTGPGTLLLSNATSPDNLYDENPHVERYDTADPNKLVLIFDSKNRTGSLDIFYTTSSDNGATWSAVTAVSTVNSTETEHQPHLYFDGTTWWLYLSAFHQTDGKLAIFRYRQGTTGNWNSWQNKELVISSGSAMGVGEPSLTASGDISFVVITQNTINSTSTDKYDSDPWFMKKK